MIRLLLVSTLLIGTLLADTSIKLEKGWQFIGFPSNIENTNAFNNTNVDIIWGYDGISQAWLGFSPSLETSSKITSKGHKTLTNIQAWQGVWIHNKSDWSLTLKENISPDANISLSQGWNLISLPADMTVSPTLFKDDIVWKYSDNTWQLSNQNEANTNIAPPISKIESAEALWVKSERTHTISLSTESSALHTFDSKWVMEAYIKEMALESYIPRFYDYVGIARDDVFTSIDGGVAGAPEAANDAVDTEQKSADATGTNLQEGDVDESDILKHDGEHIFFYDRAKNSINITNFVNLVGAQPSAITPITLPANTFLQAMFINGEKLIMITNEQRYYYLEKTVGVVADETSMPAPIKVDQETFSVEIYSISDINHIERLSKTTIDGYFNNSRVVDTDLYVISQFSPRLTIEYPRIYIDRKKCEDEVVPMLAYEDGRYIPECGGQYYDDGRYYRYDYSKPTIIDSYLIPTINKGEKDLITHDTFYAPHKLNQFPTITAISKFDITTNSFEKSVSTAGYTNKLYASSKNIYLTSVHYPYYYDFRNFHEREMIYKFSIGDDFDYKAKGFVDGTMLNQFSMSEKDDILRVATTSGQGWRGDTINSVFTLSQNDAKLEIEGTLTGLGKVGERIKGVRFLGDRGYVVTFRQTDPLYTINMSDASNPQKMGELEINGFSSYIHPVDDNFILTLGRDATDDGRVAGFIVQLFNISNFAEPTLADIRRYSVNNYGFDAEQTPQAFIYRNSDKLFGITYHDRVSSVLDILQVNTATAKIDEIDTVTITSNSYENRGIIFNLNARIYSTLFSGDLVNTNEIGEIQ